MEKTSGIWLKSKVYVLYEGVIEEKKMSENRGCE